MFQYIIQPCDTIFSISQKFGLDIKQITTVNPQINNQSLSSGQIINIPGFMYNVRSQDTLNKISKKYDIPINLLLSLNPEIVYKGNITEGQKIYITNKNLTNDIPKQAFEIESNAKTIMEDIINEDWDKARSKLSIIKENFEAIKPTLNSKSIEINLINLIDNAITTLGSEIDSKNIHEARIQAFIISEYFSNILDILRQGNQSSI